MNRNSTTPLLIFLGTVLLAGTAVCLLVYSSFDEDEFEFDTYDEHNEDYL
ncbi:hypothetical protein ACFSRY_16635 [Pontibacter locisalis]|uniref:Uncharacterized protein n=1 Tax=Pontibacter locisalis TaxID=1719035 RepID=A0ABW5IR76_9BACT